MPELAEVEYNRKQWDPGIGESIVAVECHEKARDFRKMSASAFKSALPGKTLLSSRTHGKQMLFEISEVIWLGLHLGMTGKLFAADSNHEIAKAEHFVLRTPHRSLVFSDFRMFGNVTLDETNPGEFPVWWQQLPPEILSPSFTKKLVHSHLFRHRKSLVKPLLLNQARFPGIGNWMADEIVWQMKLHPATLCGDLSESQSEALWKASRSVTRDALRIIGTDYSQPPASWLFTHRWKDGGHCPRKGCGAELVRRDLRGRTTCWCPVCQSKHSASDTIQ